MDCVVTPLKTLMGFSVYLNVQLKFYNLPNTILKTILALEFLRKEYRVAWLCILWYKMMKMITT
ncbi:hypothetical protein EQG50_07085 [Limosilactobacillus fermentum]|nr:hypothetical protein EQG50_07085 [Limosilactobacillus fermentum]